ncbi:MAG: rhodanese-like domain-containing protein [Mariprofundaceae bacterium]|nr:rhodanese-like domain-containing protein [Mariprofundaceae bacterium]
MAAKIGGSVLLLDVREPGELQAGFLPGALNVPRGVLEVKADPNIPRHEAKPADREQEIIAYCASGGRSLLAAATLRQMAGPDFLPSIPLRHVGPDTSACSTSS